MHTLKPHDTYIIGYSAGGAVALLTAEKDHDVNVIVGVSPFAGLNDFVRWALKNAKPNSIFVQQLYYIEADYGDAVDSTALKERSPNPRRIDAPVLLLQGTGDQNVPWQTVQVLARQFKHAGKTVKLVLYPGGHHGLQGYYNNSAAKQIENWFEKYGLKLKY